MLVVKITVSTLIEISSNGNLTNGKQSYTNLMPKAKVGLNNKKIKELYRHTTHFTA
jgi:hypothetical protein